MPLIVLMSLTSCGLWQEQACYQIDNKAEIIENFKSNFNDDLDYFTIKDGMLFYEEPFVLINNVESNKEYACECKMNVENEIGEVSFDNNGESFNLSFSYYAFWCRYSDKKINVFVNDFAFTDENYDSVRDNLTIDMSKMRHMIEFRIIAYSYAIFDTIK